MSTKSLQQNMTDEDRAKFERGAEMLKRAHAGEMFDTFWVPIGEGLQALRRAVLKALGLPPPKSGQYTESGYYRAQLSRMCSETPYSEMERVERSNLLFCMQHLPDIMEMRASWKPSERATVNHPTSMAKRLREFLKRPVGDEAPRRNVSPMALLRDKNEQLTRTNLDLEEQLAASKLRDGSLFDLKLDSADNIVRAIMANVALSKARTIHNQLGKAIKAKDGAVKKPAG